jgi:propane 2-monooxygenase large subunit
MAATTLSKITKQRKIGNAEASRRVADLGWTPTYVQELVKYPTDYVLNKIPKDPMRQVLRSYFPMQDEKDNRVFGALDAGLRGDMFRNVEPRWMKLFLAIIPFPEISAARSMAMLSHVVPGDNLQTGFATQMVDEMRHSTIQMNLKKWYMENYVDPAGFDITEMAFGKCYATTIGRQFAEGFITGDAITAATSTSRWWPKRPTPTRCSWRCPRKRPGMATTPCPRCSYPCNPTSRATSATATPF